MISNFSLQDKKIDVVYPLNPMAKGPEDLELRYSLRSLDPQPWAGDVYVIGHRPPWLKNALHIPMGDQWPVNFKDKNIIKKMLCACAEPRISDPFIANSDDQYWLKPINPGEMGIPPREFPAQMDRDRFGRVYRNGWVKRQALTVEFLKKNKRAEIRFDGHVPYLIDKGQYIRTMNQIPWEMGEGFLIVVYHGWNFHTDNGFKIEDRDGVLVRVKEDLKPEEIEERTAKALFLNHSNKGLSVGMKDFLKNRFPNPSRWE
jgi:hypothetical protein